MAGTQHTPRLAHTQTAFVWRFLALSAGESQIIHVTAWTEREARNRCPSGCVAVFAARIRQGKPMHNKTTPDAAEEAMQILIRALVDVTHMVESMERKSQSEHDKRKLKTIKIIAKNSLIKVTDILNEDIKRIREKICDA